jgi:hypothetical protein
MLSTPPPPCILNAYHIVLIITIPSLSVLSCLFVFSTTVYRLLILLLQGLLNRFMISCLTSRDLSYLHGAVPWFWHDFQPVNPSEIKAEWTLLIAPVCKSRCGTRLQSLSTCSRYHPIVNEIMIKPPEGREVSCVLLLAQQ